ncbi:tyrosine-type recombinase/integrase [Noviherbaspirillum galbum]|uniref:Tyrosine-type recombinase/integrase n=1 Tax=Noviherbaspirillum galbum TaxID=2709383 RepID=A0A6B3SMS7_9BURK|nr:tyrosine-type recombinase/integrase [Noviherbaspirillum galbum]NEX62160.1 tyrosine-type recombinase/integrase [Noviherbaspirillum galbum]
MTNHPAGDLFDVPEVWQTNPQAAFDAFVSSMAFVELSLRRPGANAVGKNGRPKGTYPLRKSSADVYRHMWNRFLRWSVGIDVPFWLLSREWIETFLEQRGLDGARIIQSATIRRQYLTMLERVYKHLQIHPNPAAGMNVAMAGSSRLRGQNKKTVALTPEQQQAFLDALPDPPRRDGDPLAGWEARRDRALQAIMLGAGLKVAEVTGLYTINVKRDERDEQGCVPIEVSPASAHGTVQWHVALLRPPATAIVLDWVAERQALPVGGPLLFPNNRGRRMDKTWIYRKTRETYERAGLDVPRKGGRTLRNSFAVSRLATGEVPETVSGQLGHRTARAMETYATALSHQREQHRSGAGTKSRKA